MHQESGLEYLSSPYPKIHTNPNKTCFIYLFIYSRSQVNTWKFPFTLLPGCGEHVNALNAVWNVIKGLCRTVCVSCLRNSAGGQAAAATFLVPDDAAQTCQAGEHVWGGPGGSARLHHLRCPPHTCVVYSTAAILAGAGWHTHVCFCSLKRHRGD